MADNDISVESIELALLSGIEVSSAQMMKDAYQPPSAEKTGEQGPVPGSPSGNTSQEDGSTGPNVQVYVTKLSIRTPAEEIERLLKKNPDRRTTPDSHDFYTLVLAISMRMGDPSTTRFINGTIGVVFPREIKILAYSPKEKGSIVSILEAGEDAISIAGNLALTPLPGKGTKIPPDPQENRFAIPVGHGEKISGTYRTKTGFALAIPARVLLEYRGILKNEHEMFWEIFPPMPPHDLAFTGNEMQVVFSLIVRAPKNSPPTFTAPIEGRVKGMLWGVIPVKGSVNFK
jgi:hypothetical protein